MSKYVCLTGAAGFIGRVIARRLCERGDRVYAVDRLDYAADPGCITQLMIDFPEHFHFRPEDVRNLGRLPDVDAVIHAAASTHVDNSLTEGHDFVANNVGSTVKILDLIRANGQHGHPHLIHISTDEVYGSISKDFIRNHNGRDVSGKAVAGDPLNPSSPYAASKAAADLLVQAWGKTYGIPYTIIRPTNCYGCGQYPEKLIPKTVRSIMLDRLVPIHGDGSMTRSWLSVEDLTDAILLVLDASDPPPIMNVGGNQETTVAEVVQYIIGLSEKGGYQTGYSRPAVDARYAVDDSVIRRMGWVPKGDFFTDLAGIVAEERKSFRW